MGHRIKAPSSQYTGPADSSRPPKDIFDGMEKRKQQTQEVMAGFHDYLDGILSGLTLSSHPARVDTIKSEFIRWWEKHNLEVRKRLEDAE